MIATIGIAILFVAFLLWHYFIYNSLVNAFTAVNQSWSNAEVELKRRLDLIGNLIEVVKGYAKHEADTLTAIVSQRTPVTAASATESAPLVKETLTKIFALAEAYPDIKANAQFLKLQEELVATENRIAERRHAYNHTVSRYRNIREVFPSSIVAWVHEFSDSAFFDAPNDLINQVTKVNFS